MAQIQGWGRLRLPELWSVFPRGHVHGRRSGHLPSGGTNVFTPRVEAEELCRLIADEGCTGGFIMGPTMDQIIRT